LNAKRFIELGDGDRTVFIDPRHAVAIEPDLGGDSSLVSLASGGVIEVHGWDAGRVMEAIEGAVAGEGRAKAALASGGLGPIALDEHARIVPMSEQEQEARHEALVGALEEFNRQDAEAEAEAATEPNSDAPRYILEDRSTDYAWDGVIVDTTTGGVVSGTSGPTQAAELLRLLSAGVTSAGSPGSEAEPNFTDLAPEPAPQSPDPQPRPPISSPDPTTLLANGSRLRFVRDAGPLGKTFPGAVEAFVWAEVGNGCRRGLVIEDSEDAPHVFCTPQHAGAKAAAIRLASLLSDLGYRFDSAVDG
jgi:hypothetical protein